FGLGSAAERGSEVGGPRGEVGPAVARFEAALLERDERVARADVLERAGRHVRATRVAIAQRVCTDREDLTRVAQVWGEAGRRVLPALRERDGDAVNAAGVALRRRSIRLAGATASCIDAGSHEP